MKKLILLLCFGIICSIAGYAPDSNTLTIKFKPPIEPFKALLTSIAWVESSGNPNALNQKEMAVGLLQVRQVRVDDYNMRTGKSYTLNEMYDTIMAKEVFLYYASQSHPSNLEEISRNWNGGQRGMKKQSTLEYWKKVKKNLEIKK
jgi:hypothetical protein